MQIKTILIIGGGIAGLTSAIALHRKGFDVEIIEKDPKWSVYGVGIIQQSNVVRAMASIDLLDDYLSSAFGFDKVQVFLPDGKMVAEIPAPKLLGDKYPANLGILRTELQRVLGDRAKKLGAKIRLGITVDKLDDDGTGVNVTFSDGSTGRYEMVIGADGVNSLTREQIFPDGPKPEYTGQCVWRYNFPRTDDVDCLQAYEGKNGMGLVPLSKDLMYMYMLSEEPADIRLDTEGLAEQMRQRMVGAAPAIAKLRDQIVNDEEVVLRPLKTIFLKDTWHKGRIVLIGDAIHTATPHLGQGAGMAIEDAIVLAEELHIANSFEDAFVAFKSRHFERCRYLLETSISIGEAQMGKAPLINMAEVTAEQARITAEPI